MDDLIHRQDVSGALTMECSWIIYDEYGQLTPNGKEILRTLKKIPSADAVEVVRCKDCKYRPISYGDEHDLCFPEEYRCPCQCDDNWYSWMPKDDFFCARGERKEEENNEIS